MEAHLDAWKTSTKISKLTIAWYILLIIRCYISYKNPSLNTLFSTYILFKISVEWLRPIFLTPQKP